jgi:hypothetical protein
LTGVPPAFCEYLTNVDEPLPAGAFGAPPPCVPPLLLLPQAVATKASAAMPDSAAVLCRLRINSSFPDAEGVRVTMATCSGAMVAATEEV